MRAKYLILILLILILLVFAACLNVNENKPDYITEEPTANIENTPAITPVAVEHTTPPLEAEEVEIDKHTEDPAPTEEPTPSAQDEACELPDELEYPPDDITIDTSAETLALDNMESENTVTVNMEMVPLTDVPAMFAMDMPAATGKDVLGNSKTAIDVSNKRDGYIMVKYLASTSKRLKVIIQGPSKTGYTYNLNNKGTYEVYPLSGGNGKYTVTVYENMSGSKYSTVFTTSLDVKLKDEFAPFLRPNQYVNYTASSKAVKKAAELVKGHTALLEKISVIYHFVIDNISYDKELAASISAKVVTEYIPDIDKVLEKKKGICFDYAALMAAMLRSQGIPCKLVVGYTGGVYHAWINVYSEMTGWMDSAVYFDGDKWKLMDPTYASSGKNSDSVNQYIGDGKNYTAKYLY